MSYFNIFALWIEKRTASQRVLLSFIFGALTTFSFPPFSIPIVYWLSFPALIFLLRRTMSFFEAYFTGWFFALGQFIFSLYWISDALFVDIAHFWWALPFAVVGLPALLAIFYGFAALAIKRVGIEGFRGVIYFVLIWFLADYARGHLLTGFPWAMVGYGWDRVLPVMQVTSFIGIYGLNLLTLLSASLFAIPGNNKLTSVRMVLISLGIIALIFALGEARLLHANNENLSGVSIRLVQPNVDQLEKWKEGELESNFDRLLELSNEPAKKEITHIVWPETASTFYLAEDQFHRHLIASVLRDDALLLTGVIRRQIKNDSQIHYFNSLVAINARAEIVAEYDKVHLVPFGEYIPFRQLLPLRVMNALGVDFDTGSGLKSLHVAGIPTFSPLICYEAIFPGQVADRSDPPSFLINITNDGWYGHTAGPYQHFAIVRVRAIEEGIPLARAANTGISGMIDPYGRVTAQLKLGKRGVIDVDLPKALPPTLFVRYGETGLWSIFLILLCTVLRMPVRRSA